VQSDESLLAEGTIQRLRQLLCEASFCGRHKRREQDFTRRRCFCFMNTVVLLLQKSVRSLQLRLNEFFDRLDQSLAPASASAWSQARLKLAHTAFIELNRKALVEPFYEGACQNWRGHRLVAIDSSWIHLPKTEAMGQEFGWVECKNQKGQCGRYVQGRLSVLTDVLNRLALETLLVGWRTHERTLALDHLKALTARDIALLDRGFAGYELFARFISQQRHFVCRCGQNTFSEVNRLFAANQAGVSVVAKLTAPNGTGSELRADGVALEIRVRLVTVRLCTGELEVLATSLLDERAYPTEDLGKLYGQRWGIETYYQLLKSRLDLENFTGRSVEAVRQDVHTTILLSNLESVLTCDTQRQMEAQSVAADAATRQVNRAVSFHALKYHLLELLLSKEPPAKVLQKLQRLFNTATLRRRPNRKVPRTKPSAWRSYWFQRNVRKSIF
jgi:hypothetical protein